MTSNITPSRTKVELNRIIAITAMAPAKAAASIATLPVTPSVPKVTLPPARSITSATPSPAPPLIPNTSGPASGLRKTVCIISPAVARQAPLSMAVTIWGRRDSRIMNLQLSLTTASSPTSICHTAEQGIDTLPVISPAMNRHAIAAVSPM